MKILFLTKYTEKGASSRYRSFQYLPFFEKHNINYRICSFFNDNHIEDINKARTKIRFNIILFILRRVGLLFSIKNYDIVFIEKEIIPYFPALLEGFIKMLKVKIILDYDDAIFHNYDKSKNILVRGLFKNKIPKIMRLADHIIVGSNYLKRYALRYNSKVTQIPTVVSLKKYQKPNWIKKDKFIVGWIGSKHTSKYANKILPYITNFVEEVNGEIWLVGFPKEDLHFNSRIIKAIEWSQETELETIHKFSVGLAPLEDTAFARGKCAFKIIQYMACGIPVITSDVGENSIIVNNSRNGYIVKKNEDWAFYLEKIYLDKTTHEELSKRGREEFEKIYNLESQIKNYLRIFEDLIN